ncbi:hypothetical protein LWC35_02935 [Pseudonocardia kujensis]|uniref:hypothetical protein n=1 Tax=Pseudonocardia kujensis TaxID=1128675 RepID=UPI001E3ABF14|nr:hypothetical protein [Pseudonocardia kujensis]MCE0761873.1 hypothetical protein [Pseudonocardia kujensis]
MVHHPAHPPIHHPLSAGTHPSWLVRTLAAAAPRPGNGVTVVVRSNLTIGLDGGQTANALLNTVVGQVFSLPPQPASPAPTR